MAAVKNSPEWNKYLATGIKVPSGPVPARQEIRDLSPEAQYLYFQGLREFQNASKDDPLSYFQIAGIHGLPYETWPNKEWNKDIHGKTITAKDWFGGFCTHTSILFLPWHRPYLALFESALYAHVNNVAKHIDDSDPKKQAYMTAAENFRIPYWDWARKDATIVPQEALDPKHPLNKFTFPDKTSDDIRMIGKDNLPYESTVRYPDPQGSGDNIIDNMLNFYKNPPSKSRLPALLPERNLTERVAYVLYAYSTFAAMSNNSMRVDRNGNELADAENWGSLEDIHNAVHNLVGGTGDPKDPDGFGGHMANVPVSSFDPIFWLHHCNIDRLFAIWQALHEDEDNPDSYVTDRNADWGTFVTLSKGKETAETHLYPFRPDKDHWFNSKDVKRTEKFGYCYPEIAGYTYPLSDDDKAALLETIGDIYVPIWRHIQQSKEGVENAGEEILPQVELLKKIELKKVPPTAENLKKVVEHMPTAESILKTSLEPSKPLLKDLAPNNKYLEWIVNIGAEKHAMGGAYTVHVFLGTPAESNVGLWPVTPNHVGTFAPLGQPSTTKCLKCRSDQDDHTKVTSQIPLTVALVERYLAGVIKDLSEESVKPYLTQNLYWRVAKLDGTIIEDQSEIAGLTVFVVSNEVTIASKGLPKFAPNVTIHPEITTAAGNNKGRGNGTGLTRSDMQE